MPRRTNLADIVRPKPQRLRPARAEIAAISDRMAAAGRVFGTRRHLIASNPGWFTRTDSLLEVVLMHGSRDMPPWSREAVWPRS